MSSLRINNHSRAIGETKLGDTGKPEAPADGDSFAFRLGAAGLAVKEGASTLLGPGTENVAEGKTTSDRSGKDRGKADATSAALMLEGSLGSAATALPVLLTGMDATRDSQIGAAASTGTVGAVSLPVGAGLSSVPLYAAGDAKSVLTPALLIASTASADTTPSPNLAGPASGAASEQAVSLRAAGKANGVSAGLGLVADSPAPGDPNFGGVAPNGASNAGAPLLSPGATPASPNLLIEATGFDTSAGTAGTGTNSFAGDGSDERGRWMPVTAAAETVKAKAAAVFASTGETAPLAAPLADASATTTDPAAGTGIPDQIASQLVRMVSIGPREMVMRLHPPELGDLTLRVAVSGRDVTAWFASPQPQVQNAISQALGQLQTTLGNAGYNLNGSWVGSDAAGAGRQQQNSSATPVMDSSGIGKATAISGVAASPPLSSGMSIYV